MITCAPEIISKTCSWQKSGSCVWFDNPILCIISLSNQTYASLTLALSPALKKLLYLILGIDQNEIQIQKPQEEKSPACQNQQVFCDKELPSETKNASSNSLKKFNKGSVFLLDATKEGNVGRFLNVSIWAEVPMSKHIFFS